MVHRFDSDRVLACYDSRGDFARLLGESIKDARTNAGLTVEDLAELVAVNRSTVLRWENGEMIPRFPKMVQISHSLGRSFASCFEIPTLEQFRSACEDSVAA